MPTRDQFMKTVDIVEAAKERLKGILVFDFVVPDYYASRPKPCMGGWGRGIVNITPSGRVLPCHAAESLPGLEFDNVRDKPLSDIWLNGQAFQKYRGTEWMKEPCRPWCSRREVDFGGCRCQAFAMTGDANQHRPGMLAIAPACGLRGPRRGREQGQRLRRSFIVAWARAATPTEHRPTSAKCHSPDNEPAPVSKRLVRPGN